MQCGFNDGQVITQEPILGFIFGTYHHSKNISKKKIESINVQVSLHYIHMYMYKDSKMIITMTNALAKRRFLKYNIYI